ncbi:MAG: hypothetical protein ACI4OZ_10135 [Akkermansia sp.]
MAYRRNRKAEKKAKLEEFDALMEKMKKIADHIVNDMETERMKDLCRTFLTVALGAYNQAKEDSDLLTLFDAILSQVNIHIRCVGKED